MTRQSCIGLLLALMCLPRAAVAEGVVLGAVRGAPDETIERLVREILSERVQILPWSAFREGYRGTGAEAVRNGCSHAAAHRVVLGDLVGRRSLRLRALSCDTGDIDIEQALLLGRNGLPDRRDLSDALLNLVPQGDQAQLDGLPDAEEPTVSLGTRPTEEARHDAPLPPAEPPGATETIGLEARQDVQLEVAHDEALPVVEVSFGGWLETRLLSIPLEDGTLTGYDGGGYTRVGGHVLLFPAALATSAAWARRIGLSGSLSQGVGMPATMDAGSALETVALDGNLGLVARERFEWLELRPSYSYGWKGFSVSENADVADFNYRFLRMALEARATLTSSLVVAVAGGYRSVLGLGEASRAYGELASCRGWDLGASASIRIARWMDVTVGGELVSFSATFIGDGELHVATSASDLYPSAFLRTGIVLE